MIASEQVYPRFTALPILFDLSDPQQADLLNQIRASFGEKYAVVEDLVPPRYRTLTVFPGGALEAAAS